MPPEINNGQTTSNFISFHTKKAANGEKPTEICAGVWARVTKRLWIFKLAELWKQCM